MMNRKPTWIAAILCTFMITLSACGPEAAWDAEAGIDVPLGSPTPERPAVQVYSIGTDATHPALRNKEARNGNARNTGLTVEVGDRIEIKPSALIREHREALGLSVTRANRNVCTKTSEVCVVNVPTYKQQCENKCRPCKKCKPFTPSCSPWGCCEVVCREVQTGTQCAATQPQCTQNQNQWTETSTYRGLGAPKTVRDSTATESIDLMLSGLKLRFSLPGAQVTCALSRFKPEVQEDRITFTLDHVEGCQAIFANDTSARPSLTLVNEMNTPISYSEGKLVKTWDGRVLERPKDLVYLPAIDFAGTVAVISGAPL